MLKCFRSFTVFFLLYYVLVYGTYSSKHRLHLCIVFIYKCKHNILRCVQCYLIVADETINLSVTL